MTIDEPVDPYAPPPPLCPMHGTRLDDGFCEECFEADCPWTWADELDDRDEREREKE